MNKCKDCKWYVGTQFRGTCHRHAPILSGDCGCGDFEKLDTGTNHDHDYYHDDCTLCRWEKEND